MKASLLRCASASSAPRSHFVFLSVLLALAWSSVIGAQNASSIAERAQTNDAQAQYLLAVRYLDDGRTSAAARWFRRAAEQGHARAQLQIALMLESGSGLAQDLKQAARWHLAAASAGIAQAQAHLANLYERGNLRSQASKEASYAEAVKWHKRAASQGYLSSQLRLAIYFEDGLPNLEADLDQAAHWYQQAAKQGDKSAQAWLGRWHSEAGRTLTAIKWLRAAANQGDAESRYRLAQALEAGAGVAPNRKEAMMWYELAASARHVEARYRLGSMFIAGESQSPPREVALRMLKAIAQQGHVGAMLKLASFWEYAQPPNLKRSLAWYRQAADQNSLEAWHKLGFYYYKGDGVIKDYTLARYWYQRAAEQGHAAAQTGLGALYYHGHGVDRDWAQAFKWFNLSAARGDRQGLESRDHLLEQLAPEELKRGQELSRMWVDEFESQGEQNE